ncbi:hypothetical protein HYX02_04265 [Candidatus Woesearchaeota archaeon]|nr:hypothetical protein [Candidatus Woesearchaeota archaeon]
MSGGYVKVPNEISSNPRAHFTSLPGIGFNIPYWWHDGIEAVPTEAFINQQLRNHIKSELGNCINKFEPFAGRFEINELKEPIVDVQFNENDVSVSLRYPLEVISKDGSFKALLEKFRYIVPVRFKKVYNLAKLIMERENIDYFLEKRTIDLYSIDREIPTTDIEATCNAKVWRLSNIREKLKTLLRVNLPYIRVRGTDYNPNLYVPNPNGKSIYSDTYFQQHFVWEISPNAEKDYKNTKVAFSYENWPIKVYARPSENGILKSNAQKGTDMLSFLCLHIWHFTYDIEYPVLAAILDEETDNNGQYQFNFAFKVSIDHNQPSRANKGTELFETTADLSSEEFCNDAQNEITIFTVNNATGEDINDVNLTFVCGRFYCNLGATDWLSFGAAAGTTKKLPYCINGIVKGARQGFAEAQSYIQTDVDGRSYVLALNPMKEFRGYKVVKHMLLDTSIAQELAKNEKAIIMIKGKNIGFESFAVYPQEEGFQLMIPDTKSAIYDATIYLIDEENIIGGYAGEWRVTKEELKDAKEIVFHVIGQGIATEDEKALFVSGLESYSKNVPAPELR